MRVYSADYLIEHGLKSAKCFDESGRRIWDVVWIDREAGTFGQGLRDADGNHVIENEEWVTIERIGKLALEPGPRQDYG